MSHESRRVPACDHRWTTEPLAARTVPAGSTATPVIGFAESNPKLRRNVPVGPKTSIALLSTTTTVPSLSTSRAPGDERFVLMVRWSTPVVENTWMRSLRLSDT